MTVLPVPDRGQPIDTYYVYKMVAALNDLAKKVNSSSYNYGTVDVQGTKNSTQTAGLRVHAIEQSVVKSYTVPAVGHEVEWTATLEGFKSLPVVTVTPINLVTNSPAGDAVRAVITSKTKDQVKGILRFDVVGTVTVGVEVIAIGMPA